MSNHNNSSLKPFTCKCTKTSSLTVLNNTSWWPLTTSEDADSLYYHPQPHVSCLTFLFASVWSISNYMLDCSCSVPHFVSTCPPQQLLTLYQPRWLPTPDSVAFTNPISCMTHFPLFPHLCNFPFNISFHQTAVSHAHASDSNTCTFL